MTKVSEAAHENSRPRARTNCEQDYRAFSFRYCSTQSRSLAFNGEGLIYPLNGKRGRALLSILLGCGVRRKETAELAVNDGIGIEPGG